MMLRGITSREEAVQLRDLGSDGGCKFNAVGPDQKWSHSL
jgi:hypothetical protein